jgi:hypothetical protein
MTRRRSSPPVRGGAAGRRRAEAVPPALDVLRAPSVVAALLAVAAGGCGTRSALEVGAPVAAADAGPRDASADAGGPDDCVEGELCRRDEDVPPADGRPAALRCRPPRPGLAEGARCAPAGDACARGLCVVAGTCVAPCVDGADCAVDARCAHVHARTGARALPPLRACVPALAVPPDVRTSRAADVVAPPRAGLAIEALGSTTVAIVEYDAPGRARIGSLALADGTVLYDESRLAPGAPPPANAVYSVGRGIDTLLWPASPVVPPSRGRLDVTLIVDRRTRADRVVLGRDALGSTLDLDVFLLAAVPAGPGGERGEAALRAVAAQAIARISGGRQRLGELRLHEVVGGLLTRLAVVEDDGTFEYPELDEVYALSAGAAGPSVPVFLLRQVEGVVGVSGGIPGALGRPGSVAAGVAISVELLGPPLTLEVVLAHELGHFFGLFHTSELTGDTFESIPDTPACTAERDADRDGVLSPEECAGAGAELLMFWAASGTVVTPQQAGVVVRNPVARR